MLCEFFLHIQSFGWRAPADSVVVNKILTNALGVHMPHVLRKSSIKCIKVIINT